jgi:nitroreductase
MKATTGGKMDIIEALRSRRSIRAFTPEPVPRTTLEEILEICRWAPSGGNAQPWYFAVLQGKVLNRIRARLVEKMETAWDGNNFTDTHADLPRSTDYPRSLITRVASNRKSMYGSLYQPGDSKETRDKKLFAHRVRGQRFFDAPCAVLACSEDPNASAILSVGMVTQYFCLAALSYGLGTCIMGFPVLWPEIFREELNIPKEKYIATSIAVGYPDIKPPINNFVRPREELDKLVEWHV